MLTRSIPLWVLVIAEALLVFTLGVLGNKLADLIDISTGPLYFFTLAGLVSLGIVLYLRFAHRTDDGLSISFLDQLERIRQHIPVLRPDPLDQYKTKAEKYSERSVNIAFIIGIVGGFLSVMSLPLPISEDAQLTLSATISLTTGAFLTAYLFHSLAEENRIEGKQPDTVKGWEVVVIYFFTIIFLLPGWFVGILFIALLKLMFGLQF